MGEPGIAQRGSVNCVIEVSHIHGGFAVDAYAKEVNTNEAGATEKKSYRKRERMCEDANEK